jgi:hypothetical protein
LAQPVTVETHEPWLEKRPFNVPVVFVIENERLFPDSVVPVNVHDPLHVYVPAANVWPATVIVQAPPVVVVIVPLTPPSVALNVDLLRAVGGLLSE